MALIFADESGLNPLMPGVFVTVFDARGNVVGTGWTFADGSVAIPVQGATPYNATFTSTQLTSGLTASFFGSAIVGGDTLVPVPGATPTLYSQLGRAAFFRNEIPKKWIAQGDPGLQAISEGIGGGLAIIDASLARLIASLRGQTAQGADLDSWAFDFFGNYVRRYPGEDDATFYARLVALMGPRRTCAAIKAAVIAWYAATLKERIAAAAPELAYDESGEIDKQGGFDTYVPMLSAGALTPAIDVWDSMTQPAEAAEYGITTNQFVISIGFTGAAAAWYLDRSFLDIDTFLIDDKAITQSTTPPDPRLGAYVNLVKAAGMRPIYQVYST